MKSNDLMPGSRKQNRFEARRSLIAHCGRFSLAASPCAKIGSPSLRSLRSLLFGQSSRAAQPCVNSVNFVNLPTPYFFCNVKNGGKSTEKGMDKDLHNKLPTPLHSSQCSQCSQTRFLAIFHQLLECIFYNLTTKIRVLLSFCEANEYVCTFMKPKAIFCYGMCEHCELGVFMKFTQFINTYSLRGDSRSAQKEGQGRYE